MVLNGLLKTVRKIYFSHNVVLWMILTVLPICVSLFTMGMFSSEIVQHVPIGVVKQDNSQLADKLESKLRSSPVLNIKMACADMGECEHAVIRGEIQAFIVFPNDMERRALRLREDRRRQASLLRGRSTIRMQSNRRPDRSTLLRKEPPCPRALRRS